MYARVTLLEIDTLRIGMDDAVALFKGEVLPGLQAQEGLEGVAVLTTPEGKGMIFTLWATEEGAQDAAGFGSTELERYMTLFRAPPGREHYAVAFADLPGGVLVG
jgi:hypothetical protein